MKKVLIITGVAAMFTILSCRQSVKDKTEKIEADSTHLTAFIKIGSQIWAIKNLNVATFRNGDPIPEAESQEEWKKASDEGKPAWCYYNGDTSNGSKYGKLYNWYAVHDGRGLAPKGWHIPSDKEWSSLVNYLGGDQVAGAVLKNASLWANKGNGSNSSGFSALPAGFRTPNVYTFSMSGMMGPFWSSSEYDNAAAWSFKLSYDASTASCQVDPKIGGYSVRCIKDNTSASQNEKTSNTTDNNLLDYLKTLNGKHLFDKDVHLWNNAEFKKRLIKLIGNKFSFVKENWQTDQGILVKNNIFNAEGFSGTNQSIIIVDLANNIMYVAINDKLYNETGGSAQRFQEMFQNMK